MRKTYVNCPKCDDEFEFGVTIECDGALRIDDEKQRCNCEFDETEMDALRDQAFADYEV